MRVRRELNRREFCGAATTLTAAGLASAGLQIPAWAASANEKETAKSKSWPSFRNGNQLRGIASSDLPDKLELLWKVAVDDGVTATAAIVDGRVYAGTFGGELICLDRKTGGVFHAVERDSGNLRWKFETMGEIISSALIVDDRVIFGSYDATLYCLNVDDGSVAWKFDTLDRINGSPAIAGDITFVTGCDQHLRAINIKTGKEEFDMELERFLIASPAVVDYMLYVGTHEGEFLAIDVTKQEVEWRYADAKRELPIHSSAAVTDELVVFGSQDKQLHCHERKDGKPKWEFTARGQLTSSPVIVGDRVFVGSNDGNVYEVGLADGKQRWKEKLGRTVSASPAVGEGCLVIGAEGSEGEIYCFGSK